MTQAIELLVKLPAGIEIADPNYTAPEVAGPAPVLAPADAGYAVTEGMSVLINPAVLDGPVFLVFKLSYDQTTFGGLVAMLGYTSMEDAEAAFAEQCGAQYLGVTTEVTPEEYRQLVTMRTAAMLQGAPLYRSILEKAIPALTTRIEELKNPPAAGPTKEDLRKTIRSFRAITDLGAQITVESIKGLIGTTKFNYPDVGSGAIASSPLSKSVTVELYGSGNTAGSVFATAESVTEAFGKAMILVKSLKDQELWNTGLHLMSGRASEEDRRKANEAWRAAITNLPEGTGAR